MASTSSESASAMNGEAAKSEVTVTTTVKDDVEDVAVQSETWIHLHFTWSGKPFELDVAESDRVFDLKALLQSLTDVPPDRQKILGLVKGKLPPDEICISELKLAPGKKFQLIGTPQGTEFKDPSQVDLPPPVDDISLDALYAWHEKYARDRRTARKIEEHTRRVRSEVRIMNPLRGRKLLVLDLDYTILDTKPLTSGALPPTECARPGLHGFLRHIYQWYDICIWSQTSWIWLETKLVELGMLGMEEDQGYKIAFVLDKTSMFTVFSERNGKPYAHAVKALKIIWNVFPQFGPQNTIHVDDLSRNFALNPTSGLKINPFRDAHLSTAQEDHELPRLARYMAHIATVDDFSQLRHKDWKKVVNTLPSP